MSDDFPMVPRQHEVSRAAARWVEGLLPGAWVVHKPSEGDDYGSDLRVEVVENGGLTGRQVVLQVKGTADPAEIGRVRLKRSTLNYLAALSDPAVVLRVCTTTQSLRLISVTDPRLWGEDNAWTGLEDCDEVLPGDLSLVLNRISCRHLVQKGRARIAVGLDNEAAVRRTALSFEGRLDGVFIFELHSTSPWQQYSSRHVDEVNVFRLQNLIPPRQHVDIPFLASLSEMIAAHVSFLLYIGLGQVGAQMLLRASPIIGNKLVNVDDLITCAATFLTPEECATILRSSIRNGNWWGAFWITTLLKRCVGIHLAREEIERAFALQAEHSRFLMLPVCKGQALLAVGEHEAALQAAMEARANPDQDDPVFYFELSDIFARCGHVEECVELLSEARKRFSKTELFSLEEAKYLIMLTRFGEAHSLLRELEEPKSDPMRSLYRLSTWLASTADEALKDGAAPLLRQAWGRTRQAFLQRKDPTLWATAAIALEQVDVAREKQTSGALFIYSATFFGGDVARLVLEHPFGQRLDSTTQARLTDLATTLDAWRGGLVAVRPVDGELQTIKIGESHDTVRVDGAG